MAEEVVAKRYGTALFEVGKETGNLRELYDEAGQLTNLFRENDQFLPLLMNPQLTREQVQEIIHSVFDGRISVQMENLILVLVDKRRQKDIEGILTYFQNLCKEEYHIGVVYITAPMPVSGVQKQRLESDILKETHYTKLEMHYVIDPSIIGGLIIRIGDRVVDTSVRTKLDKLTNELMKIQLPEVSDEDESAS